MLGTEFEEQELAEPTHRVARPQRVLVLGGGVAGFEAARMAAARGHVVEVWEKAARPGGQIHLAVAAPDKEEVRPVWSYRFDQAMALGVTLRCGVAADEAAIRDFAPDHVVVATGATPRPLAVEGTTPVQAWDVIANPALVPEGAAVAIIGGGIVGLEVADVLLSRRCRLTVLEVAPTLAPQMARNNRTDLMLRLREAGVGFHTKARVQRLQGNTLVFSVDGKAQGLEIDLVIAAIGAVPNRDMLPAVEATGIPYTLVGDANLPGDFLSVLRDASMTGLGIGLPSERL